MIHRPEGQWHPGVIDMYRLLLGRGWKVESCRRMTKADYADWPEDCAVFEIELVSPQEMVDAFVIIGPPGTSHG